jgi:hypothetical protein
VHSFLFLLEVPFPVEMQLTQFLGQCGCIYYKKKQEMTTVASKDSVLSQIYFGGWTEITSEEFNICGVALRKPPFGEYTKAPKDFTK